MYICTQHYIYNNMSCYENTFTSTSRTRSVAQRICGRCLMQTAVKQKMTAVVPHKTSHGKMLLRVLLCHSTPIELKVR